MIWVHHNKFREFHHPLHQLIHRKYVRYVVRNDLLLFVRFSHAWAKAHHRCTGTELCCLYSWAFIWYQLFRKKIECLFHTWHPFHPNVFAKYPSHVTESVQQPIQQPIPQPIQQTIRQPIPQPIQQPINHVSVSFSNVHLFFWNNSLWSPPVILLNDLLDNLHKLNN